MQKRLILIIAAILLTVPGMGQTVVSVVSSSIPNDNASDPIAVSLNLYNVDAVSELQFNLEDLPDVLSVTDVQLKGRAAAEMLQELMETDQAGGPVCRMVPSELWVRSSCGCGS